MLTSKFGPPKKFTGSILCVFPKDERSSWISVFGAFSPHFPGNAQQRILAESGWRVRNQRWHMSGSGDLLPKFMPISFIRCASRFGVFQDVRRSNKRNPSAC